MVEVVSATAEDCWVALAACSSAVASSSPALRGDLVAAAADLVDELAQVRRRCC